MSKNYNQKNKCCDLNKYYEDNNITHFQISFIVLT